MIEDRVTWIERNLPYHRNWTKHDLQEFYERDVTFLLDEVVRLRSAEAELKHLKRPRVIHSCDDPLCANCGAG